MSRTVHCKVVREFSFELEVEDDVPKIEDDEAFFALYGHVNVGDDSMLVETQVTDPKHYE